MAERLAGVSGEEFALLTSPTSTNEEHYLAQKFARVVMGTNNVDHTSNLDPELVLGLEDSLGVAAATNPIWDLERAGCILAFNTNVTEEQNVVAVPIKRAARKNTKLVVIDSREVELTRYAHIWLRPAPGTELTLLAGILRSIVDQGLEREEWLEENCESPATLRYSLRSREMAEIVEETRVSEEQIAAAARMFAEAAEAAVVYGLDNIDRNQSRNCVLTLVNLALLTGNIGRPGTGLYPMRRGANEQGAWDVGGVPDRLPGYRRVSDANDRAALEAAWGAALPDAPGLPMAQMVDAAASGNLKAAVVIGDSPNFTNGKIGDAINAFGNLDLLVVHDTFLTPLAQRADVVLPRPTFAEKDGTFTNLERRVQRLNPASRRETGARPEGHVLTELAQRIKPDALPSLTPAEIMDEIAGVAPIYGGISPSQAGKRGFSSSEDATGKPPAHAGAVREQTAQGPANGPALNPAHPGTAALYSDGFSDRKAIPLTPSLFASAPELPEGYGLWFAPGRVLLQQNREMEIVKGKRNRIKREEWVDVNPDDAAFLGLPEGAKVAVQTAAGQLPGVARFDAGLPRGMVASTALFGQLAIDMEASEEFDPAPMLPGLDVRPARLIRTQDE